MTLPIAKPLLSCTCALLMTLAAAQSAEAGGFFHSAGYGSGCCGSYYTGYSPSYYGYGRSYGVGYRGYGGWGTSYASYYSPSYASYYAPSYAYYGSSCGTGCSPCGNGGCGVSYGGGCGSGCGPCGVSYGSCGSCCNSCGLSSCGGCGIACADGCGTGVSSSPEPAASPNEPYDGTSPEPSTFGPDTDAGGDADYPPPRSQGGGGGDISPDFGDDTRIERGANKLPDTENGTEQRIEQRKGPAPAEPGSLDEGDSESDAPPEPPAAEADVPMANVVTAIVTATSPERTRLNYTVRFYAPKVARVDIAPNRNWVPVETETKLAASK